MGSDVVAIVASLKKFISGEDVSIANANALEASLDEAFPDDNFMQDTILMLASYRPGGGDYLYGEHEVKQKLEKVLKRLE
jgi:hypothetical protein